MASNIRFEYIHRPNERTDFTALFEGPPPPQWTWDFGDGTTETTTVNAASHYYEQPPLSPDDYSFYPAKVTVNGREYRLTVQSRWRPLQRSSSVLLRAMGIIEAVEVDENPGQHGVSLYIYRRQNLGSVNAEELTHFTLAGAPTLFQKGDGTLVLLRDFGRYGGGATWWRSESYDGGRTWNSGGAMTVVWNDPRVKWATLIPLGWGAEASIAVWRDGDFVTLRFKRSQSGGPGASWVPDQESTLIVNLDKVQSFQFLHLNDGTMLITNCIDVRLRCYKSGENPTDWIPG